MSLFGRKKGSEDDAARGRANRPAPGLEDLQLPAEPQGQTARGSIETGAGGAALPGRRAAHSIQGDTMARSDTQQATSFRPELPRRPVSEIPGMRAPEGGVAPAASAAGASTSRSGTDPKTLIVGKEISLNGEISSCDRLIVEGKVEASLAGCQFIEIADGGIFKGAAEIHDAEIRGLFEGKLTVEGRLLICATGRVVGEVRYGQIEIECGGEVSGTIDKTRTGAGKARTERTGSPAAAEGSGGGASSAAPSASVGVAAGAE